MKFKRIYQIFFLSHIENILCYPFTLKYLNKKSFLFHIKKHNFFSCEHKVYILKSFKFHIEKIIFFLGT